MNRRSMFRALIGAGPAVALSHAKDKGDDRGLPAEIYAHTPPQKCSKCGFPTVVMSAGRYILPGRMMLMACSNYAYGDLPGCDNRWPWIESGGSQTRVSAEAMDAIYRYEKLRGEAAYPLSGESEETRVDRHGKMQAIEIFLFKNLGVKV